MKILLDTHFLLWSLEGKLTGDYQQAIINLDNEVFVSIASIWEIYVKKNLGKLKIPDDLEQVINQSNFKILQLGLEHIKELDNLPMLHRDPFDRILAAQAKSENMALATKDAELVKYNIPLL